MRVAGCVPSRAPTLQVRSLRRHEVVVCLLATNANAVELTHDNGRVGLDLTTTSHGLVPGADVCWVHLVTHALQLIVRI